MNALFAIPNRLQAYVRDTLNQIAKTVCRKVEGSIYSFIVWRIDAEFRDNILVQREIKKIDITIERLEAQQDEVAALQELLPDMLPPRFEQGMCQEERRLIGGGKSGVAVRQNTLRNSLIEALKTHRICSQALLMGIRKQQHIVEMKSEFVRLQDLLHQAPRRKVSDILLPLSQVDHSRFPRPHVPLMQFPARAYDLRYPEDTNENCAHAVVTLDAKLVYKDERWNAALRTIEEAYLTRSFTVMTVDELRAIYDDLAARLDLTRRSRECVLPLEEQVTSNRHSVHEALKRWGSDFHLASHAFSAADWEALSQENFVPLPPQDIEESLVRFFNQLQLHLQNSTLHPFQIAGFIHWALTRMRPFQDGNGSMARLYMNIWLMQSGFAPLVVTNNQEYVRTFLAPNYIQAFGHYLAHSLRN